MAAASGALRASKSAENAASVSAGAGAAPCAAESATPASAASACFRSALRRFDVWFAKLCGIDRNVQLHVAELEVVAAVEPCVCPAERKLDSADIAVVAV